MTGSRCSPIPAIRSGLDVVRMLALGANGVLLGRAYIYALAAAASRCQQLLDIFEKEMRVAMALTGAASIGQLSRDSLA